MKRALMILAVVGGVWGGAGLACAQVAAEPKPSAAAATGDELERVVGELKKAVKEEALARVLGFYSARVALLERIEKEMPALAEKAKAARESMERELGPGATQLELEYAMRGEGKAAALKTLRDGMHKEAAEQKLSEADLTKSFATGALDPQGQPPRNVQLLLAVGPENLKKPERVFDAGFVTTAPLAAAGGDRVGSIRIPTTFGLVAGEKPGDRLTFAYGGYAPATITVTVDQASPGLTPEKAIENVVSGNAATLKAKPDKARVIDTPSGRAAVLPVDMTVEAGGKKSLGRGEMYLLPVGDKLVGISMTVQAPEGEGQEAKADALWARFEPVFQRIRGSVVIDKK